MFDFLNLLQPIEFELTVLMTVILFDVATRLLLPSFRDCIPSLGGIVSYIAGVVKRKMNRTHRTKNDLLFRGILAICFLLMLVFSLVLLIHYAMKQTQYDQLITFLILFSCIGYTKVWSLVAQISKELEKTKYDQKTIQEIFKKFNISKNFLTNISDRHAVIRICVLIVASSINRGFLTPIFWFCIPVLFGFSGIDFVIIAVSINEIYRVIILEDNAKTAFQYPFKKIEHLVGYIPGRLSGVLLWIVMFFVPKLKPLSAIKSVIKQSYKYHDFNNAWAVASLAGGLHIALPCENKIWIENAGASAKLNKAHLRQAMVIHYLCCFMMILFFSMALFLSIGF